MLHNRDSPNYSLCLVFALDLPFPFRILWLRNMQLLIPVLFALVSTLAAHHLEPSSISTSPIDKRALLPPPGFDSPGDCKHTVYGPDPWAGQFIAPDAKRSLQERVDSREPPIDVPSTLSARDSNKPSCILLASNKDIQHYTRYRAYTGSILLRPRTHYVLSFTFDRLVWTIVPFRIATNGRRFRVHGGDIIDSQMGTMDFFVPDEDSVTHICFQFRFHGAEKSTLDANGEIALYQVGP